MKIVEHTLAVGETMTPDQIGTVFTAAGFVFDHECPYVIRPPWFKRMNADRTTTFVQLQLEPGASVIGGRLEPWCST